MADRESELQTSKQHPIPQNIMSVEFKLIGDMTVKQFVYLAVGILVAYLVNASSLPFFFRYPIAGTFLLGGIGMAFFPIEDRGLDQWVKNFLVAAFSPQQMIWRKDPDPPRYFLSDYAAQVKKEMVVVAPDYGRNKVSQFLNIVEKESPDPYLEKETMFLKHLNSDIKSFEDYSLYDFPEDYGVNKIMNLNDVKKKEVAKELEKSLKVPESAVVKKVPEKKNESFSGLDLDKQLKDLRSLVQKLKQDFEGLNNRSSEVKKEVGEDIKIKRDSKMIDRKLKAITLKTEDIDKLDTKDTLSEEILKFREELKALRGKNKDLEKRISKQKSLLKITDENSKAVDRYKKRIEELEADKLKMQKEIFSQSRVSGVGVEKNIEVKDVPRNTDTNSAEFAKEDDEVIKVRLTNTPNVINGVIRDTNQKLIEGAVVIVKDSTGNSVRALKSNELGQFIISTPLTSGSYDIEVIKKGYDFGIISVVVDGSIMRPILVSGRVT